MPDLNDDQRQEILDAIKANRKIDAIKMYREYTGFGLKESKEFIEELTGNLRESNPDEFQKSGAGCGTAVLLFAVFLGSLLLLKFA